MLSLKNFCFFSHAKTMQIYIVEKNVRKILFSTMKNRHFLDLFFVLQKKIRGIKTK